MAVFQTHTGLTLEKKKDPEGLWIVTLSGDRTKLLHRGADEVEARRVYNDTVAHYKQRKTTDPKADA